VISCKQKNCIFKCWVLSSTLFIAITLQSMLLVSNFFKFKELLNYLDSSGLDGFPYEKADVADLTQLFYYDQLNGSTTQSFTSIMELIQKHKEKSICSTLWYEEFLKSVPLFIGLQQKNADAIMECAVTIVEKRTKPTVITRDKIRQYFDNVKQHFPSLRNRVTDAPLNIHECTQELIFGEPLALLQNDVISLSHPYHLVVKVKVSKFTVTTWRYGKLAEVTVQLYRNKTLLIEGQNVDNFRMTFQYCVYQKTGGLDPDLNNIFLQHILKMKCNVLGWRVHNITYIYTPNQHIQIEYKEMMMHSICGGKFAKWIFIRDDDKEESSAKKIRYHFNILKRWVEIKNSINNQEIILRIKKPHLNCLSEVFFFRTFFDECIEEWESEKHGIIEIFKSYFGKTVTNRTLTTKLLLNKLREVSMEDFDVKKYADICQFKRQPFIFSHVVDATSLLRFWEEENITAKEILEKTNINIKELNLNESSQLWLLTTLNNISCCLYCIGRRGKTGENNIYRYPQPYKRMIYPRMPPQEGSCGTIPNFIQCLAKRLDSLKELPHPVICCYKSPPNQKFASTKLLSKQKNLSPGRCGRVSALLQQLNPHLQRLGIGKYSDYITRLYKEIRYADLHTRSLWGDDDPQVILNQIIVDSFFLKTHIILFEWVKHQDSMELIPLPTTNDLHYPRYSCLLFNNYGVCEVLSLNGTTIVFHVDTPEHKQLIEFIKLNQRVRGAKFLQTIHPPSG
jgi:hypothetical protein